MRLSVCQCALVSIAKQNIYYALSPDTDHAFEIDCSPRGESSINTNRHISRGENYRCCRERTINLHKKNSLRARVIYCQVHYSRTKKTSEGWFRSNGLEVMSLARSHCATSLQIHAATQICTTHWQVEVSRGRRRRRDRTHRPPRPTFHSVGLHQGDVLSAAELTGCTRVTRTRIQVSVKCQCQ